LRSSSKKTVLYTVSHLGAQSIPIRATFGAGWPAAADANTNSPIRMIGSVAAQDSAYFQQYRAMAQGVDLGAGHRIDLDQTLLGGRPSLMSGWGQSEKSGRSTGKSALPPTPDIALHRAN
jgi:hypothetical protein